MVGVLRWAVDLGQVDILLETALMSTYLAFPRRRHFKQVFQVFGYVKAKPNRKFCFDPQHPKIDECSFAAQGFYSFYQDAKGAILTDDSTPRVNVISTHFLWTRIMQVTGLPGDPILGS